MRKKICIGLVAAFLLGVVSATLWSVVCHTNVDKRLVVDTTGSEDVSAFEMIETEYPDRIKIFEDTGYKYEDGKLLVLRGTESTLARREDMLSFDVLRDDYAYPLGRDGIQYEAKCNTIAKWIAHSFERDWNTKVEECSIRYDGTSMYYQISTEDVVIPKLYLDKGKWVGEVYNNFAKETYIGDYVWLQSDFDYDFDVLCDTEFVSYEDIAVANEEYYELLDTFAKCFASGTEEEVLDKRMRISDGRVTFYLATENYVCSPIMLMVPKDGNPVWEGTIYLMKYGIQNIGYFSWTTDGNNVAWQISI